MAEHGRKHTDDNLMKIKGILRVVPVGSRITCKPPPENTDIDYLVLMSRWFDPAKLAAAGYELDSQSEHYDPAVNVFNSWRKGDINLIATKDQQFFSKFLFATKIAKELNLLNKKDRITLFQAVLY